MTTTTTGADYAGDLQVQDAWDLMKSDAKAQIVDVRTAPEWSFVGQPDVSSLGGRHAHLVEWQTYPAMAVNPNFVDMVARHLAAAGAGKDTPVLFLCRSGARSRAAAVAMTKAGFSRAYNIAGGFEGDVDASGHRGRTNGWKAANLPWRQS
ncbi:MAG TPA: rhodanese-like domain-containing protein [Rhizomicrobium sp.]|nr:rhodanese-like domain-containing protein [Rhizomicrobium sp.]